MVSQAQRWVASGVSMGRNRRTSNTLQLRAVNLKWPQSTKNLTPEGAPKAAETLNSSYIYSNLRWHRAASEITIQTVPELEIRGGRRMSAVAFLEARDFLLAHRDDYATAY